MNGEILEIAKRAIEKRYLCDNCLGRQFAQLLTGMDNEERGRAIRTVLAMEYEVKPFKVDMRNFYGFKFRGKRVDVKKGRCDLCGSTLSKKKVKAITKEVLKKLKGYEFRSFVVG